MEHFEYAYLLTRAHFVKRLEDEARGRGEVFHASDTFEPLASGLEGQARIVVVAKDDGPLLVLRLRHHRDAGTPSAVVEESARRFFERAYTRLPPLQRDDGTVEHVFFSTNVPDSPVRT